MTSKTIHIKNMCCARCIEAVADELKKLGLEAQSIELGAATYAETTNVSHQALEHALEMRGFKLITLEEERIAEQVKNVIIQLVHDLADLKYSLEDDFKIADFIAGRTGLPYRKLYSAFVKYKKNTIEKYFILQRIEKIKELLQFSEMSLSEISSLMGYNSPQHLSAQFRKSTGMSMIMYKKTTNKAKYRKHLDKID